jgi:CDP-glucose 4,6-dehydratase
MTVNIRSNLWPERSVLVTGATGFLGGWLVRALLEERAHVVALIRDTVPTSMLYQEGLINRIVVVQGDVQDGPLLRRILSEYSVSTVFHLAAQAIVGVANADPVGTLETNVRGTWTLLEAARQCRVREIVVASSDKAYGASANLPYLEDHPLRGQFPYDVSKSCADLICAMYADTYKLPVVVTRCANLFGGGDLNFSRTIPGVILATSRGERFRIRSDGSFVRDLLYVKDAVTAYMTLATALANDSSLVGEAFIFSSETRISVLQLVRQVLEVMGQPRLEPIIQNIATAEIREQYMDCEKSRRVIGWSPFYTLEQALRETVLWYRHYFKSGPHSASYKATA